MAKSISASSKTAIPLADVHLHIDKICPPEVRQRIVRELYLDYIAKKEREEKEGRKVG